MKRSKVYFLIFSIIFFIIMAFFVIDFARRTTFPGDHKHTSGKFATADTTSVGDSVRISR